MPIQTYRTAALAALIAASTATLVLAQDPPADPHHPEAGATDTAPPAPPAKPEPAQAPNSGEHSDQPETLGEGMMGGMMQPEMMGEGMMGGGMMRPGSIGPRMTMHGHAMRILFAIVDADGSSELSFEEVTAIHRRIFDAMDADGNGTVSREEAQAFLGE